MRQSRAKYGNKRLTIDGVTWDSKREYQRWLVLRQAEKDGLISELERQPKFELVPAIKEKYVKHLKTKDKVCERTAQLPITYTADFRYIKDGNIVVEDVKASPHMAALDPKFLIKEKLFRWKFGFPIKRVYKPTDEI